MQIKKIINAVSFIFALSIGGCIANKPLEGSEVIQLVFSMDEMKPFGKCTPLATIVASEGHWYTFWFLGNDILTQAALDSIRNQSLLAGGNLALVTASLDFTTSMDYVANVYECSGLPVNAISGINDSIQASPK